MLSNILNHNLGGLLMLCIHNSIFYCKGIIPVHTLVSLVPIMLSFFLPSNIHISESNILPIVGYYNSNILHSISTDTFAYYILCVSLMVLLFLLSCFNKAHIYHIYCSHIVGTSIPNGYHIYLYI